MHGAPNVFEAVSSSAQKLRHRQHRNHGKNFLKRTSGFDCSHRCSSQVIRQAHPFIVSYRHYVSPVWSHNMSVLVSLPLNAFFKIACRGWSARLKFIWKVTSRALSSGLGLISLLNSSLNITVSSG